MTKGYTRCKKVRPS